MYNVETQRIDSPGSLVVKVTSRVPAAYLFSTHCRVLRKNSKLKLKSAKFHV